MNSKTSLNGDMLKREYSYKQVILILLILGTLAFLLGFAFGVGQGWSQCVSYGISYLEKAGFFIDPLIIERLNSQVKGLLM